MLIIFVCFYYLLLLSFSAFFCTTETALRPSVWLVEQPSPLVLLRVVCFLFYFLLFTVFRIIIFRTCFIFLRFPQSCCPFLVLLLLTTQLQTDLTFSCQPSVLFRGGGVSNVPLHLMLHTLHMFMFYSKIILLGLVRDCRLSD